MTRFLFVLLACLALPGLAAAETRVQTKEDLAKLQSQLAAKQAQQKELEKQRHKTEGELQALRQKLVSATTQEKASAERLDELQSRMDELQKKEEEQQKALGEQQSKLSGVLAAMMRLSRMPPEVALLFPDAPIDNLRSAILLHRALPYYAEKAEGLSTSIEKLHQTREAIRQKRQDLMDAQRQFSVREQDLNGLLGERQSWLQATESQRADIRQQIEALSSQAQTVQELLNKVTAASVHIPIKKLLRPGPVTFTAPVKGRLIYGFGDRDDVGSDSRGLMMSVRSGEIIVAPADGQVVFAGPFKGYGNILILRHNDDYHSFLAGFGRVDATVGQVVNAGEPLGRAPDDKSGKVQVYFELRYRGSPVDPMRRISATVATNRG